MDFSSWSIEKRFSVLAFIVLLLLGTVILIGNLWFVTGQLLNTAARYTETWTNSVIRHQFQDVQFSQGLNHSELNNLNLYFQKNIMNQEIRMVRVWNSQGLVVFSSEPKFIGMKAQVEKQLQRSLQGETIAGFLKDTREQHINESDLKGNMLEIFSPIYAEDNKNILGAFELHIADRAFFRQIGYNYRTIILSIIGALITLYAALIGIMRKASSTIRVQSKEINELYLKLDNSLAQQEKYQIGTIKALLETLNAKDHYTAGHSVRVAEYATRLGKKLGLPSEKIKTLEEAALFHDIGKIGIPENVLNKPGKFTDSETELMRKHPLIGADIVNSIEYFREHSLIIRHHHERFDGTGYPEGLTADKIPMESMILAIVDTYDALTTDRPYRKGMTKGKAIKVIREVQGTQLNNKLVETFLRII